MQRIPGKTGALAFDSGFADRIGYSAQELKSDNSKALSAEVAPLPSKALQNLIGGSRANDHVRLDVPRSADPFHGLPNRQNQDYLALQRVINNSDNKISNEIVALLNEGISGVPNDSLSFIKASIGRESKMLLLLRDYTEAMGRIHIRVVGSQEG